MLAAEAAGQVCVRVLGCVSTDKGCLSVGAKLGVFGQCRLLFSLAQKRRGCSVRGVAYSAHPWLQSEAMRKVGVLVVLGAMLWLALLTRQPHMRQHRLRPTVLCCAVLLQALLQ